MLTFYCDTFAVSLLIVSMYKLSFMDHYEFLFLYFTWHAEV